MNRAIERRLGVKTAELYARIASLVELAIDRRDDSARTDLAKIGLATLRGDFHDYRAGHPLPKGDLVTALRGVHLRCSTVAAGVIALIDDVVRGAFADGAAEAARLVEAVAPSRIGLTSRARPDPVSIDLTERESRVFVWLYRYLEVYGLAPLMREIAAGLESTTLKIAGILRALERKGAVVKLGGHRGWLPVRAP